MKYTLFFDIDGTLLNTGGSGMASLQLAFAELFDQPFEEPIPTGGRTDQGIARFMFSAKGIEYSQDHWERFHEAYTRHLSEQLSRREGFVLPGVLDLLDRLAVRDDVDCGLLTGNTALGARLKLQHFDLHQRFAFGGFGELAPERNGVAREAMADAEKQLQREVQRENAWVIGDTILDVRCARHIGVKVLAVCTGASSREDLAAEKPDLLLEDLQQAERFLEHL